MQLIIYRPVSGYRNVERYRPDRRPSGSYRPAQLRHGRAGTWLSRRLVEVPVTEPRIRPNGAATLILTPIARPGRYPGLSAHFAGVPALGRFTIGPQVGQPAPQAVAMRADNIGIHETHHTGRHPPPLPDARSGRRRHTLRRHVCGRHHWERHPTRRRAVTGGHASRSPSSKLKTNTQRQSVRRVPPPPCYPQSEFEWDTGLPDL